MLCRSISLNYLISATLIPLPSARTTVHRTNLWDYPRVNTPRDSRLNDLDMHLSIMPIALTVDAMLDCSKRGGIVPDGIAGSGTTLIAAEHDGRRGYAMEIDPKYVDTAIRRWQAHTGG